MKTLLVAIVVMTILAPMAIADDGGVAIEAKYPVKLYGFIKADFAYDDSRVNNGNYARWVESEATNKDDSQINITARQSRFGLKFGGPELTDINLSGKVEVDFYEGGAENKNRLLMRHAYMKIDRPDRGCSLIAGQTSDVISPLMPSTLNYTVGWWVGNPGYRRPQIRLTKTLDAVVFEGALTRTIGDDWGFSPGDTGEDADFPTVQARIGFTYDITGDGSKKLVVGVSGHYGKEEYDVDETGAGQDFDSWSTNLDLTVPLSDTIKLMSEVWQGKNMDAYLAGIGQGVNQTMLTEIESKGGWAALSFGPYDAVSFNIGAAMDNPDDNDLNDGNRSKNTAYWANILYNLNSAAQVGLEISSWDTEYKNQADGDSLRAQTSFIYKF